MTIETARGYLQCKIEKNHQCKQWQCRQLAYSLRLFTMLSWKESDVNNYNAESWHLFTMQNWKESGVNNDNADSSRLFTMPN